MLPLNNFILTSRSQLQGLDSFINNENQLWELAFLYKSYMIP